MQDYHKEWHPSYIRENSPVLIYKPILQNMKINLLNPPTSTTSQQILFYDIFFPVNIVPKITQLTYNNRIFCTGPPELRKYLYFLVIIIFNSATKDSLFEKIEKMLNAYNFCRISIHILILFLNIFSYLCRANLK